MELNKIYNTDCLYLMEDMDKNSIDMTITSPPYDTIRDYNGYAFDYKQTIDGLFKVMKNGGVVVWVVADSVKDGSETLTSFNHAFYFKQIGFKLHDTMIYRKNSYPFPPSNRYYQQFEYMFVFCKGKLKTFNPIFDRKNKHSGSVVSSTEIGRAHV